MSKDKLTPKQELFCKEYVIDFNASRAARDAGYSPKTADATGRENLRKPAIARRIAELKAPIMQRPEDLRAKVLKELEKIAFADANDFFETIFEEDEETGEKRYAYHQIKPDILKSGKAGAIQSFEPTLRGVKLKVYDKQRALELLGKHIGLFNADTTQKPEVNQFDMSKISSEKLKKIREILKDDPES